MNRNSFESLCRDVEAGDDIHISHPGSHEEGIVTGCVRLTGHLLVETTDRHVSCWDYHECVKEQ